MEAIIPDAGSSAGDGELRGTERIKLDISIAYSFETFPRHDGKPAPPCWGTLLDISRRGICFKAHDHFFIQRVISLYLKLTHQTSGIKMLGKVIWTATDWDGATRVGVQFIGALPSDWRKLVADDRQFERDQRK